MKRVLLIIPLNDHLEKVTRMLDGLVGADLRRVVVAGAFHAAVFALAQGIPANFNIIPVSANKIKLNMTNKWVIRCARVNLRI